VPTDPWSPPAHAPPAPRARAAPSRVRVGLQVGALAAATTLGAFVGFGARGRAPLRVLSEAGLALRGLPEIVSPDRGFGLSALTGVAQHLALALAWGAAFAAVAGGWRGARLVGAALLVAAIGWAADVRWLPPPRRLAAGALAPAERVLAYALLAGALAVGTRIAFPVGERRRRSTP
jgi:hypothetical protein